MKRESHCRLCNLEDFSNPELKKLIREVFPHEIVRFGKRFPKDFEYRKHWEVAMAIRALEAGGALRRDAEILGVGAGAEPTLFWLTNRVRRVFATDLYLQNGEWADQAPHSMLTNPDQFWPNTASWRPRRLVVQNMDALDLRYEDESFDGIFTSSSIEHFGDQDQIRQSVREMARVLKPGGILSLSTEFNIQGEGPGLPGVHLFTQRELEEVIIGTGNWRPLDEPDFAVSSKSLSRAVSFAEADRDVARHVAEFGQLFYHRLTWSTYPHVVLEHDGFLWTSVHLALRKE